MFKFKDSKQGMCLIPVAFDHMLFQFSGRANGVFTPVRFESEKSLEADYLAGLCREIEKLGCPVCLDMRYVSSAEARSFEIFARKQLPVFFCGVSSSLKSLLIQDLGDPEICQHPEVFFVENSQVKAIADHPDLLKTVKRLYQERIHELLYSVTYPEKDASGKPAETKLKSSGVYVNSYVALKDLFFLQMDDALFVLYEMAERIYVRYPAAADRESKTLVSCSRTGAAYASLLSMLLNMRAVYCKSVGPEFALDTARLESEIQAGQDYIYVFDFLCMGTEAKILHALISCLGGNLLYGIGVANYLDITAEVFRDSFFSKLETLSDIQSAVTGYRVRPIVKD